MTTGKTIILTRWTSVGKVMSLLFNMLSRLVIAFFPRSKRLLIWWLQSPSAVILEPKKIKSLTVSIVSPSICHEVMGLDAMILVFWMLSFKPTFSLSSFLQLFYCSPNLGDWTTDWFQTGKGVRQGCILSPCLVNLYAEYIMRNAGLDEAQAGIKIAR